MGVFRRVSNVFFRAALERKIDAELRSHIEMRIEDNLAAGMSPKEARRAALVRFGNSVAMKERVTAADAALNLASVWSDVRYACRQLRKSPGFAVTAILTLALGIGANTAIFSVVNGVLLNSLPFAHADRLVWIWGRIPSGEHASVSGPDYLDYRAQARSFQKLSAFQRSGISNWSVNGTAKQLQGTMATADFFDTLGTAPMLGRDFAGADEQTGQPQVAILSYHLWQEEFGGRPDVIGQTARIDGDSITIVGVMPSSFDFPTNTDFWYPVPMLSKYMQRRVSHGLRPVGLLKPGTSLMQAQQEVDAIAGRLANLYPTEDKGWSIALQPMQDALVGSTRSVLLILLGAVGMVLLIACVNITNLLLARNAARQREIAIRLAIGAGKMRLLQQFMTESLVLSLLSGLLAILFGYLGVELVRRFGPANLPRLNEVHLNLHVLAYTAFISTFAAIFFGLLPAWLATNTAPQAALRDDGRAGTGRNRHTLGSVLIVSETTLSVCLLIAAALLLQSLWRTLHTSPGFSASGVLTTQMVLPDNYQDSVKRIAFEQQLTYKVRALPGVETVGAIEEIPLGNEGNDDTFFQILGQSLRDPSYKLDEDYRVATPMYFPAMGISLLRGRLFNDADRQLSQPVALIDEPFARKYFPHSDPIGRHLLVFEGTRGYVDREIIGEVSGVRQYGLKILPRPILYFPYTQIDSNGLDLVVRSSGDPRMLAEPIRQIVAGMDAQIGVAAFQTLDEVISESASGDRFDAILIGMFAGLALILAMAGVYGVFSYIVAQQTRDIGVRIALGARPAQILRMVLRRGIHLAILGSALGIVAASFVMRALASQLYQVKSYDPTTYFCSTFVLIVVALGACYLPARRAASVNPVDALRAE